MGKKDKDGEAGGKGESLPEGQVTAALAQTARAMRGTLTRQLGEHGLYAGQDAVIMALADADGQSPGVIAEALGVRAPTITKTINRLAAQGFVERRESAVDGRRAQVHLTEAGSAAVAAIRKAVKKTEKTMLRGLSGKEAKTLAKLLRRAERNLVEAA